MGHDLSVSIEMPAGLMDKRNALRFYRLLVDKAFALSPERYGNAEPLRTIFNLNDEASLIDTWDEEFGVMWERRKSKAEATMGESRYRDLTGTALTISAKAGQAIADEMIRYTKAASEEFNAHFAYIHLLTQDEFTNPIPPGTVFCNDRAKLDCVHSVALQDLAKYVPDIYWAMVFGRIYVEHFGRETLLSAPAPLVEELSGGQIYMQMSNSPLDLISDFQSVQAVRDRVKTFLNNDSFWDQNKPSDYVYRTPDFRRTVY